jgi:hypothetical protein
LYFLILYYVCCFVALYYFRKYALFNFSLPVEMIPTGIRTYVIDHMRDRESCGSVRRLKHPTYGQCIHIRVTGTVSALTDLEEFFSNYTTDGIWTYEEMAPEEPKRTLPHHHFTIIESGRGATCGENSSNPDNDNRSESTHSIKSGSVKSKVSTGKKYMK